MSGRTSEPAPEGHGLRRALHLEQVAMCDTFTGVEIGKTPWGRIYGGQVLAQALVAAQRTVDAPLRVHSVHGYFILAGETGVEVLFKVDRVRDGKSFATRAVKALQRNRTIFILTASFHREEPGYSFQEHVLLDAVAQSRGLQRMPLPKELLGSRKVAALHTGDLDGSTECIVVDAKAGWQLDWRRHKLPLGENSSQHHAILAWMSDSGIVSVIIDACSNRRDIAMGLSLDHTIHFHRPFKADDWLLFHTNAVVTAGARGYARSDVYNMSGELVASVTQETLIRPNPAKSPKSRL
eukprot:TRINITY_DN347_c0_g1_i2.p1 TRINITY_DN347_c0_g1~~TRINITY_DN347_c0_g1_i2.p1  ORF type:complete len:295 (+),score=38.41 TRINITY_DN347_c0_g1_i2:75-959(+)